MIGFNCLPGRISGAYLFGITIREPDSFSSVRELRLQCWAILSEFAKFLTREQKTCSLNDFEKNKRLAHTPEVRIHDPAGGPLSSIGATC
jgi:hypothetical protein